MVATQRFFIFTSIFGGRFPIWLIFFKWVGSTTNQNTMVQFLRCVFASSEGSLQRCFPPRSKKRSAKEFQSEVWQTVRLPAAEMTCHVELRFRGWTNSFRGRTSSNKSSVLVMYGQYDSWISMFCVFQGTTLMCRCGEHHTYTILSICIHIKISIPKAHDVSHAHFLSLWLVPSKTKRMSNTDVFVWTLRWKPLWNITSWTRYYCNQIKVNQSANMRNAQQNSTHTVDGRNPAPPEMYKTVSNPCK